MSIADHLTKVAEARGLKVVERGKGHFQVIGGPLLVNWYPFSSKQSAYVAGTTARKTRVTAEQAVEMAFLPPLIAASGQKDDRKGNYRAQRRKMLKFSNKCHWCGEKLTLDTSTMDHVIPLHRGGLDNANNRVLACESCNSRRGHDMPELGVKPLSSQ